MDRLYVMEENLKEASCWSSNKDLPPGAEVEAHGGFVRPNQMVV